MCLNIPGKVIKIGKKITLKYPEEERAVDVSLIDLAIGDFVIVSGGVIVSKVEKKKAVKFLKIING
jgi:hydrogenase maturation factor